MSHMTHSRRKLGLVLLVGTCLAILSFNPSSASNAPRLSHIDSLPPQSLVRRDLLGSLIGKPPHAPVTSSPSPNQSSGNGGDNTLPSPVISNPGPNPDPTPGSTESPHSSSPSSSSPSSSKSPAGPPIDPGDVSENDPDPKGKPSSDASYTPTASSTKKKVRPASPSVQSATSSDNSSNQQYEQADASASAVGTDNNPALGNNGSTNSNDSNSSSASSRPQQEGNGQGLTPGLIALLVTVLLAITTAVLLSCYKIRQARTRSNRRRQRGLSATSGISNLVIPSDLETVSWHENLLKSSGGHTRNQSLQSHASHPNSLHHHHQLHHQLHHPYVGGAAYDAPPTPPMVAAHIVGNRGSPGRCSQGGGRDDPWRKNLGAFHRE